VVHAETRRIASSATGRRTHRGGGIEILIYNGLRAVMGCRKGEVPGTGWEAVVFPRGFVFSESKGL
jgi:hypothetical protein